MSKVMEKEAKTNKASGFLLPVDDSLTETELLTLLNSEQFARNSDGRLKTWVKEQREFTETRNLDEQANKTTSNTAPNKVRNLVEEVVYHSGDSESVPEGIEGEHSVSVKHKDKTDKESVKSSTRSDSDPDDTGRSRRSSRSQKSTDDTRRSSRRKRDYSQSSPSNDEKMTKMEKEDAKLSKETKVSEVQRNKTNLHQDKDNVDKTTSITAPNKVRNLVEEVVYHSEDSESIPEEMEGEHSVSVKHKDKTDKESVRSDQDYRSDSDSGDTRRSRRYSRSQKSTNDTQRASRRKRDYSQSSSSDEEKTIKTDQKSVDDDLSDTRSNPRRSRKPEARSKTFKDNDVKRSNSSKQKSAHNTEQSFHSRKSRVSEVQTNVVDLQETLKLQEEEERKLLRRVAEGEKRIHTLSALRQSQHKQRRREEAKLTKRFEKELEEHKESLRVRQEKEKLRYTQQSRIHLDHIRAGIEMKQKKKVQKLEGQLTEDLQQLQTKMEKQFVAEREVLWSVKEEKLLSLKQEIQTCGRDLTELKQEHQMNVQLVEKDHQRQMESIREKHQEEVSVLQKQLHSKLEEEKQRLQATQSQEKEKLNTQHQLRMQKVRLENVAREAQLQDDSNALELRESQLKKKKVSLQNQEEELAKRTARLASRGQNLTLVIQERDTLKTELDKKNNENQQLRQYITGFKDKAKARVVQLREERDRALEEKSKAESDFLEVKVRLTEEKQQLSASLGDLEQVCREYKLHMETMERKNAAKETQLEQVKSQLKDLKASLQTQEQELHTRTNHLASVEQEVSQFKLSLSSAVHERDRLKTELERETHEKQQVSQKFVEFKSKARTKVVRLQEELAREIRDKDERCSLEMKVRLLEEREQLQASHAQELKHIHIQYQQQKEELHREKSAKDAELELWENQLKNEKASLQSRAEELNKRLKGFESDKRSADLQREALVRVICELERELERKQQTAEMLRQELEQSKEQTNTMKRQCKLWGELLSQEP